MQVIVVVDVPRVHDAVRHDKRSVNKVGCVIKLVTVEIPVSWRQLQPHTCRGETAEKSRVQSLLHGSRGKFPYFCRHPSAIRTDCKMRRWQA